eukprot:814807-Pyramimonas_sp.AAC.1
MDSQALCRCRLMSSGRSARRIGGARKRPLRRSPGIGIHRRGQRRRLISAANVSIAWVDGRRAST